MINDSWGRRPVEERYQDDPVFHSLVTLFYKHMDEANELGRLYTPTELREACMFAATLWESRHIRPIILTEDQAKGLNLR